MRELEYELVHYTVNAHRPAYKLQLGVVGIVVDEIVLYRDGLVVESVAGTQATFALEAEADASFVVVAQGSTPMGGVWGNKTPWALASAILLDVDQDGWKAPHGSLD